ncbi:MAG: response regulator [Kiritimatiellia bacterium]
MRRWLAGGRRKAREAAEFSSELLPEMQRLLTDLVNRYATIPTGRHLRARLDRILQLPPALQVGSFGRHYLLLERYLSEYARSAGACQSSIRGHVATAYPELAELDPLRVILLPFVEQEIAIAITLLREALAIAIKDANKFDKIEVSTLFDWLKCVPRSGCWPPPIPDPGPMPAGPADWVDRLEDLSRYVRSNMQRYLGERDTVAVFRNAFELVASSYQGLESFSFVYALLPDELIDEDKLDLLTGRRLLKEKVVNLQVANQQLEIARNELHATSQVARKTSEALQSVLDTVGEAILSIDARGLIRLANRETARLWPHLGDSFAGVDFEDLLQPAHRERFSLLLDQVRSEAEGPGQWIELEGQRAQGASFPLEIHVQPSQEEAGDGFTLAVRDLTSMAEGKRREHELRTRLDRAERMESLGLLAGGVAHDLNNILGPLVGYPPLILDLLPPDSDVRPDIEEIGASARRASAIIQDLLTMSRRGHYETGLIDLNQLIRQMTRAPELVDRLKTSAHVEVVLQLDEDLSLVKASGPHLTKALVNLAINSVEAMPAGGRLTLRTEMSSTRPPGMLPSAAPADAWVVCRVIDTGSGIPEQHLRQIFEPFYTTKRMGRSGSGLGLSVVYGVAQDLQGQIDVRSEPGRGTEFMLALPAVTGTVAPADSPAGPLPRGTEKVLVIDDVAAQRKLASRLLASLGYEVETADHGRAGVARLEQWPADLILLDMVMEEGFDGLDTYRVVHERWPHIACVIASGFSESDRAREARARGAEAFIKKPYTLDQLAHAARKALDTP